MMTGRARRACLSAVVLACWPGRADNAVAAPPITVPENGSPGLLWLTSDPYPPELPELSPGDVVWWQVGAHLSDQDLGALTAQVAASGEAVALPGGVEIEVRTCGTRWTSTVPPACPGGAVEVLARRPLASVSPADVVALGQIGPSQSAWVLFAVSLPATAGDEMQGRTGRLGAGFTASGDASVPSTTLSGSTAPTTGAPATTAPAPTTSPATLPVSTVPAAAGAPGPAATAGGPAAARQPLPATGGDTTSSALLAAGAVGAGLAIAGAARRRARRVR
jgi:LPXTG-motif cell wall-anchored protein